MGDRALENRIKKLKALEEEKKALEEQAEILREEIQRDMESKGTEEIKRGNFIVRWKKVISNRFDSKAFKAEHGNFRTSMQSRPRADVLQ